MPTTRQKKKDKHVYMQCPNCGKAYEREPMINVTPTGRTIIDPLTKRPKITFELPRKCDVCGMGLVRRIEK